MEINSSLAIFALFAGKDFLLSRISRGILPKPMFYESTAFDCGLSSSGGSCCVA